jgi:DsbC/DsbD-like thiol-disulfide interchange protein
VQVRLIADRAAIAPSETFTLAVEYTIAPQWHIYWSNPGDAGTPTAVDWQLPTGFARQKMRWPIPKRFTQSGLVGYGYEKKLVLAIPVMASRDVKPGDTVTLKATTDWLVCRELCIPGDQNLELTLPVKAKSAPANEAIFAEARRQWPGEAKADGEPRVLRTSGSLGSDGGSWMGVALGWTKPPKEVAWYPAPPDAVEVTKITARTFNTTTRVQFQVKRINDGAVGKTLDGLLVYTDESGQRRAVWTRIPLTPST